MKQPLSFTLWFVTTPENEIVGWTGAVRERDSIALYVQATNASGWQLFHKQKFKCVKFLLSEAKELTKGK